MKVHRLIARNYNATPEVLMILVNDEDEHVRQGIIQNEAVTPEILKMLGVKSK